MTTRRDLVKSHSDLTVERQCELLDLSVSTYYYKPIEKPTEQLAREDSLRSAIDRWHTGMPYLGSRRLVVKLAGDGIITNRKEVSRLMREMGIYAVYPRPNLSMRNQKHKVHPYLLRNKAIFLPNQVWALDITYIAMKYGYMFLTAIIDWFSRFIVGWALSDTLETVPVIEAVESAIERHGTPAILNSDQGPQFTSDDYVQFLKSRCIQQSMDGKARWVDNVVIERWFRSLKYEDVYINEYNNPKELRRGIAAYVEDYNYHRPHQSHEYETPADVFNSFFHECGVA